MKRTPIGLLNINIPVVVCQLVLWYNKIKMKGEIMLFIDLIDIIYLAIGVIIGATVQAYLDSCICDDCERGDKCEE